MGSLGASASGNLCSHFYNCTGIWQSPLQQWWRDACQISERRDHKNAPSRGFETSRRSGRGASCHLNGDPVNSTETHYMFNRFTSIFFINNNLCLSAHDYINRCIPLYIYLSNKRFLILILIQTIFRYRKVIFLKDGPLEFALLQSKQIYVYSVYGIMVTCCGIIWLNPTSWHIPLRVPLKEYRKRKNERFLNIEIPV